jgi:hypothetical protein
LTLLTPWFFRSQRTLSAPDFHPCGIYQQNVFIASAIIFPSSPVAADNASFTANAPTTWQVGEF